MSLPSRPTRPTQRSGLITFHRKAFYALLLVLAFLMPFKFGLVMLDALPNPSFGSPSLLSLLEPLEPWATEVAELLIVLAAFFWLLGMIVTRRLTFRYTKADYFLWAFLAVGLVSSFFSILPHSAVMFMKAFVCWALLYHLVVNFHGSERQERALVAALLAGLVCVSLIGLHQRLAGYERAIEQVYRSIPPGEQPAALALLERARVMATFSSPNSLGGLYALLLPSAFLFVLVIRQWTERHGAVPTILYALLGPLLGFGVFILTESKGAFISVALVVIAAAVAMSRRLRIRTWKLVAVLVLALGVAAAISATSPGRKLLERGAWTFEQRLGYWKAAAQMTADRPPGRNVIGSGFNAFAVLYPRYKDPPPLGMARNAHNNYVQLFIEVGVLGLAAFMGFWAVHLGRAARVVGTFARGEERLTFGTLVVLAAFFGLLAFLLHSLVDFDLYVPSVAMTAMFLAALMARHSGPLHEKTLVLRKEIHAVSALAVLMLVTGPLVLFVPMPMTAEIHFFNAHAYREDKAIDRPRDKYGAAITEMRQALQWDPLNHNYVRYLAGIYAERGMKRRDRRDIQEAVSWYERALRLNANSYNARYGLAMARLELMHLAGDIKWDSVLDEVRKGVELHPTDSFMRLRYVCHLDQAGRHDEAKRQFDTTLRYDDESLSFALQNARRVYNRESDFDAFKADVERLRATYGTRPLEPTETGTNQPNEEVLGE